jgi:chemotaxis protein methyltransferase WspC
VTAQMNFEALLKETMGLDSASVGSSTIDRAVRVRMAGAGIQKLEEYWQRVQSSSEELQELIETVVVPETWFFRDREAFAALARFSVEEWLPSHGTAPLRALSVPCSTGEEPYSIVMALIDEGVPAGRIHVDAIDISDRALARARHGEYGANSFRGEYLDFRARYFSRTAGGFSVAKWLPDRVTFRKGNLLSPDVSFGQEPYDVVFCRNLLIYFDRLTQSQIMRTLGSLLSSAGVLFVGGAETYLASRSGFTSLNQAMSFAFRKTGAEPAETVHSPTVLQLASVIRPVHPRPVYPAKTLLPAVDPVSSVRVTADLATARRLADAGRLQEAADWCENDLQQPTSSPEAWYLLGLVRNALGDEGKAAECYRKLLYLDPDHVEALTHLALLTEKNGDTAGARRLRERARRAVVRPGSKYCG